MSRYSRLKNDFIAFKFPFRAVSPKRTYVPPKYIILLFFFHPFPRHRGTRAHICMHSLPSGKLAGSFSRKRLPCIETISFQLFGVLCFKWLDPVLCLMLLIFLMPNFFFSFFFFGPGSVQKRKDINLLPNEKQTKIFEKVFFFLLRSCI